MTVNKYNDSKKEKIENILCCIQLILFVASIVIYIAITIHMNKLLDNINEHLDNIHENLVQINELEQQATDSLISYELYLDSQIQELSVIQSQTEDLLNKIQESIGDK